MNKFHKSTLIGLGAIVLSTVAIQASDIVQGVRGNLAGLAIESQSVCGEGSVLILMGSHSLCVDAYEASASELCPKKDVTNQLDTQENANVADCVVASKPGVQPWRFVSLTQAQQFCGKVGKRLPTNEEWYKTISGFTATNSCVIDNKNSQPSKTGSSACVTQSGIYDMVGNVWEWIDGEVTNGTYNNRQIPASGFVSLVDSNGVVVETTPVGLEEYGNDYAQTSPEGVRGMLRGGFYGSKDDAGIFAQNLSVPLDFKSAGVGFRCVKDI